MGILMKTQLSTMTPTAPTPAHSLTPTTESVAAMFARTFLQLLVREIVSLKEKP